MYLEPAQSPPKRVTLIVLTAISVLTLNLFLPSLPSMARDFSVSYAAMSSAIAAYLALSAGLGLVLGPVSDRWGRRPVLLASFAVFTLAAIGAATAQSFAVFMAFRMLQAIVATGSILSRAIVRDVYPPGKGTSVLGYISMAMAIAPMIGPMLGGVLEETLGWRSVFWTFAVLGGLACVMIWSDLGETSAGLRLSWRDQLHGYGVVLQSRCFWDHAMLVGFSVTAFFVFLSGAPYVAAQTFGLAPSVVGIAMGTTALGFFIGSFIAGRLSERVALGAMMVWGRAIGLIGPVLALGLVLAGQGSVGWVFGLMVGVGLGNGISLPSANTGVMSVRTDLAGSASGLSMAISTLMGALGSWGTGLLITQGAADFRFCALIAGACSGALIFALRAARSGASQAQ